ncbi:Zn-dependent exopeptidase [Meira miltonrushii]|uniref:Peptide hydrolase n=1 Tax=Meira miltonrushii TaxID=1280837 RepID=A0A316VGD5_9BASI|nr:Zn-dependent exopeptidase [Meira miltonrushii]PWN36560.1 Zn-dependent exopeptidase [Meira miltonrushii]
MNSLQDLLKFSMHLQRDTRIAQLTAIPKTDSLTTNATLPKPTFNPPLHALLFSDTLDVPQLREDARILSGEDEAGQWIPSGNHWHSRHSATQEARLAGAWIRARLARYLAPVDGRCIEWTYDDAYAPNIVCTIPVAGSKKKHEQEGVAILSAHYDSRGTFGSTRAPGADDDGSGTTMLLAVARHLGKHRIEFNREIRLVAFSGEEQGLVGSKNYAKHLRDKKTPVHFQLQADMLGYRKPGEPLQVAFPDKLATQAATDYVIDLARLYVPELQIGYTPACCSDHQSFWEQGFTSTWVFERRAPIADPCYHDSCDLTERKGYDFEQIQSITKLCLATVLDVGGGVDWPY